LAYLSVVSLKGLCLYTVQLAHATGEITFQRFHQQVVVITHQTLPVESHAYIIQNGQEWAPVVIDLVNIHSSITA